MPGKCRRPFSRQGGFSLNERGLRQAAELGSALRPYSPEAVMTSPCFGRKTPPGPLPAPVPSGWKRTKDSTISPRHLGRAAENRNSGAVPRAVENLAGKPRAPRRGRGGISRRCSEALHGGPRPGVAKYREDLRRSDPQDGHQAPSRECLGIASPYFWKVHMDTGSYSILVHDDLHGYSLFSLNRTDHLSGFITEWCESHPLTARKGHYIIGTAFPTFPGRSSRRDRLPASCSKP